MRSFKILAFVSTVFAVAPAYSAVLTYQFNGTLTSIPSGTSVQVDDTFSGAWALETNQPIQMLTGLGFSARQYNLQSLTLNLGGETVIAQSGVAFVSESTEESGQSTATSDYVVIVPLPDLPQWNVTARRILIVLSFDGLGIWNNLESPTDFPHLGTSAAAVLLIDTLGGEFGGGEIRGQLASVAPAAVPLPSPIVFLGGALPILLGWCRLGSGHPRASI
jgi:hypothetical protein